MNLVQYGNHVSFEDIVLIASCLVCLLPLFIAGAFIVAMIRFWLKGGLNVNYPTRYR